MKRKAMAAALRDLADRILDGPETTDFVIAIKKAPYWYVEGGDTLDNHDRNQIAGVIRDHWAVISTDAA